MIWRFMICRCRLLRDLSRTKTGGNGGFLYVDGVWLGLWIEESQGGHGDEKSFVWRFLAFTREKGLHCIMRT